MTDLIRKSDARALAEGYWQSIGGGLPEGKSDEAIIDTAEAIAAAIAALEPVAAPDGYCWPCHYAGSCAKHPAATQSELVQKMHKSPNPAAIREAALEACTIIDAAVREGHDNLSDLVLHLLSAAEAARRALALIQKGAADDRA